MGVARELDGLGLLRVFGDLAPQPPSAALSANGHDDREEEPYHGDTGPSHSHSIRTVCIADRCKGRELKRFLYGALRIRRKG